MDSRIRWRLLLTLLIVVAVGCSGTDRPPMAKVSGTVTFSGKPVEGAQVTFKAEGAPRAAIGRTDAQGNYQLTTFDSNDGAVLGKHSVTIAMVTMTEDQASATAEDPSAAYGSAMDAAAGGAGGAAEAGGIPTKYANADTSGLEATVTDSGPNEFNFDLE